VRCLCPTLSASTLYASVAVPITEVNEFVLRGAAIQFANGVEVRVTEDGTASRPNWPHGQIAEDASKQSDEPQPPPVTEMKEFCSTRYIYVYIHVYMCIYTYINIYRSIDL